MFINKLFSAVSSTDIISGTDAGSGFSERLDLFYHALSISGKGLLGIFIVTLVIIFLVLALNKLTSRKNKSNGDS